MTANFWRALEALNEAERKCYGAEGRSCRRPSIRGRRREPVHIPDVDRAVMLCRSFGVSRTHLAQALDIRRSEVTWICDNARAWFVNYGWPQFETPTRSSLAWL
jgi:hypothetical protein